MIIIIFRPRTSHQTLTTSAGVPRSAFRALALTLDPHVGIALRPSVQTLATTHITLPPSRRPGATAGGAESRGGDLLPLGFPGWHPNVSRNPAKHPSQRSDHERVGSLQIFRCSLLQLLLLLLLRSRSPALRERERERKLGKRRRRRGKEKGKKLTREQTTTLSDTVGLRLRPSRMRVSTDEQPNERCKSQLFSLPLLFFIFLLSWFFIFSFFSYQKIKHRRAGILESFF